MQESSEPGTWQFAYPVSFPATRHRTEQESEHLNRIFYFTGTGNSLAISKALAEGLEDTHVESIASAGMSPSISGAERIGLVFPVFGWGMPRMAVGFAKALRPSSDQYVFAVATCAGSQATTLKQLRKILRSNGSDLNAGFAVRGDFQIQVPGAGDIPIIRLMERLCRNSMPPFARDRIAEIVGTAAGKRPHAPETSTPMANALGSMIYGVAVRSFMTADRGYSVTDACVSCGICAQVCPRENVTLENGRPTWHQDCELCYACMAWCPKGAILYRDGAPEEPTHHPDVSLNEVQLR